MGVLGRAPCRGTAVGHHQVRRADLQPARRGRLRLARALHAHDVDARALQARDDRRGDAERADGDHARDGFGARLDGRGRPHRAVPIVVDAAAGLAPEPPRAHQFELRQRRRVAAFAEGRIEHGLGHREVDVVADQVHQLEWPHREAAAVAHDGVDRRRFGGAFGVGTPRLAVEGARDAVDDETRRRTRVRGVLAPRLRVRWMLLRNLGGGLDSADHLDQPHPRRRIEEVHPDNPLRPLQSGRHRRHGQRRRVGGKDAAVTDDRLEFAQQAALDVEVLDDRLDHEPAAGKVSAAWPAACAPESRRHRQRTACPSRRAPRGRRRLRDRALDGARLRVDQSHRWPACAATSAMPAPIAPAPMTPTGTEASSARSLIRFSLATEPRRALLHEGGDAFAVVG